MTTHAPHHRHLTVQVWGNAWEGYTGYNPQTDVQCTANTFDEAEQLTLEAARHAPAVAPDAGLSPEIEWTCSYCTTNNPDGRSSCSSCGHTRM